MRMSKLASTLVLTLALVLMITGIGHGQASTFTISEITPVERLVYVDCAAGGAGEFVYLTGNIHSIFHITEDPTGGMQFQYFGQPMGISGVGMTTGDSYQGTGVSRDVERFSGFSYGNVYTEVINFRIIGQGTGNNLMIQDIFHYTITPQGELTAWVEHGSETCQ